VAMLTSKELNIIDNPKLIGKRFLEGDFNNKNKKLKEEVIIKLLINVNK
jgi:hypothetical protein